MFVPCAACVVLALASSSISASTQSVQSSQLPVLKQLSIEELVELDVTLPLRRDERIMNAPASRGFASTSANKILAMIDGRSVYSPLFSGVFWEQQDAMLLDLERGQRGLFETIDPNYMARIQGRFDLPGRIEFDVMTHFMGALPQITASSPRTPAYNEAGFRLGWHVLPSVEVALIGRDVLRAQHVEFASPTSSRVTYLERALFTRATLSF